jgi:hypothetical protein
MDLDGDGLAVDPGESGTADRGEHGDLPDTRGGGGPDRGDLDGTSATFAQGCDSHP